MTPALELEPLPKAAGVACWLGVLAGVFALRVVAQPFALVVPSRFLPRFESFHSGALPCPVLLLSQVAILWWLIRTARRVATGAVHPSRRLGRVLLAAGAVYASVMLFRLALGLTVLSHVRWFASPVPTVFHLGLAAYLLCYGSFHFSRGSVKAR